MDHTRLRELMEATRPSADDQGLSAAEALELRELLGDDPELAADLERMQAWDRQISTAFVALEVPSHLADKLRVAVAQELAAASPAAQVVPASNSPAAHPHRRRWLYGVLTTAAGLLIAAGVWSGLSRSAQVQELVLLQEVAELDEVVWQTELTEAPRTIFPSEVRSGFQRWGHVATRLDREAVVFDLVRAGAPRALLIAMHSPNAQGDLALQPEFKPGFDTGGVSIGAWQQEPYVYVLVVDGSAARYRAFLNNRARTLAQVTHK